MSGRDRLSADDPTTHRLNRSPAQRPRARAPDLPANLPFNLLTRHAGAPRPVPPIRERRKHHPPQHRRPSTDPAGSTGIKIRSLKAMGALNRTAIMGHRQEGPHRRGRTSMTTTTPTLPEHHPVTQSGQAATKQTRPSYHQHPRSGPHTCRDVAAWKSPKPLNCAGVTRLRRPTVFGRWSECKKHYKVPMSGALQRTENIRTG